MVRINTSYYFMKYWLRNRRGAVSRAEIATGSTFLAFLWNGSKSGRVEFLGQDIGVLRRLAQVGKENRRHFLDAEQLRRFDPSVARENVVIASEKDWICEPELANAVGDLTVAKGRGGYAASARVRPPEPRRKPSRRTNDEVFNRPILRDRSGRRTL
jgi:hypothetical protein